MNLKKIFHQFLQWLLVFYNFMLNTLSIVGSYFVLFDLYLIWFTGTRLGLCVLSAAALFGVLYVDVPMTNFQILCLLYASYVFGVMVLMRYLLKKKKFEKWCFDTLGEKRVRRLVYRSPGVDKILALAGASVTALIGGAIAIDTAHTVSHDVQVARDQVRGIAESNVVRAGADTAVLKAVKQQLERAETVQERKDIREWAAREMAENRAQNSAEIQRQHQSAGERRQGYKSPVQNLFESVQKNETIPNAIDKGAEATVEVAKAFKWPWN